MNNRKTKGFTLIEVIASIAIISIIFGATVPLSKMNSKISNDIKCINSIYEIENLLSYAKVYCKNNKQTGEIQIYSIKNKITFKVNNKKEIGEKYQELIKEVILPSNIQINRGNEMLKIGSNGHIKNGVTISLKDKYNEDYSVSVRVGIDLITSEVGDEFKH